MINDLANNSIYKAIAKKNLVPFLEGYNNPISPYCEHFSICSGCSLQFVKNVDQLEIKERFLMQQFKEQGLSDPNYTLAPITAKKLYYRHKARLSVRYDRKKDIIHVGFRERKNSRYVANMDRCHTLHPKIGALIPTLKHLISALTIFDQIPQLEIAISEKSAAIIIRNLKPCSNNDIASLHEFGFKHNIAIYLQPGNESSIHPIDKNPIPLSYYHDRHEITIDFKPVHFTQINFTINKLMVTKIIDILDLNSNDTVLDLFCGIGNFTLPIAKYCKSAIGVELSKNAIKQAKINAKINNIDNVEFYINDLINDSEFSFLHTNYTKVLIDPPRSGAANIISAILPLKPNLIIYVSCNPKTIAKDAKLIINSGLYEFHASGIIDMFPQTSHIESISVFKLKR